MKIYFYLEENGCVNSGRPILVGDCEEYLELLGATAVFANGPSENFSGTAICLGDFDGVHTGHRALFDAAKKSGKWGVLLFDRNIKGSPLLTTMRDKLRIISELGADYAVIAEFSEKFSKRSPQEFVEFLKEILRIDKVIAGYDYRFGYNASGDTAQLESLCQKNGIALEIIEPILIDGEPVKSTKIRACIENGDIYNANRLLGYSYTVSGEVIKGLQNGRKMGFPTANVDYDFERLLPKDGVYAGYAYGKKAVINIGKNPTFSAKERTLEVHLLDFEGDLYGKRIDVEFLKKLREDIKFESVDALITQIERDVLEVKGKDFLWQKEL